MFLYGARTLILIISLVNFYAQCCPENNNKKSLRVFKEGHCWKYLAYPNPFKTCGPPEPILYIPQTSSTVCSNSCSIFLFTLALCCFQCIWQQQLRGRLCGAVGPGLRCCNQSYMSQVYCKQYWRSLFQACADLAASGCSNITEDYLKIPTSINGKYFAVKGS